MQLIPITDIQIPDSRLVIAVKDKKDFITWVGSGYAFKYEGKNSDIYYAYDDSIVVKYIEVKYIKNGKNNIK